MRRESNRPEGGGFRGKRWDPNGTDRVSTDDGFRDAEALGRGISSLVRGVILPAIMLVLVGVLVHAGEGPVRERSQNRIGESEDAGQERHLTNIRQLTTGGKNAEAYFSFEGDQLIFQSTKPVADGSLRDCYQMYLMDVRGDWKRLVSTGQGTTTCGYFFPGGRRILYSSTHLQGPGCPPQPSTSGRYRWSLDDYDIFSAGVDGAEIRRLTSAPGYDAEATVSPDGRFLVFTSIRDGDLELYTMKPDGSGLTRLTRELGYDGGAFFSPDGKRIVYRAHHPQEPEEIARYKDLLARNLVEPSHLEIYLMNADGTGKLQITSNGAANFAPFFHPDGDRIIFSSNLHVTPGSGMRPTFHLYLINDDGSGLEQVTFKGGFNSFPMFSPDGTQLVWVSDRNAGGRGEFNVFLADWVP